MESMTIRRGTGPLSCRNLLLTIDVLPFLSIAADTPARGTGDVGRKIGSNRLKEMAKHTQLYRRSRTTTLSAGMMPFGKSRKALHEGR